MSNYALILESKVVNIIVADDQETANLFGHAIEYTDDNPAHIGLGYDGNIFEQPFTVTPNK